ncbi:winged helix-turn-helix transcriptional regulator [Spirillospora sp. CA-294931]|uniref:winged helix-turn-helix transcriptional regulator n=1 Tax=Spirillospora sp. CA-294931 TaxID=3240042 RepID=UPI003D8CAEBF
MSVQEKPAETKHRRRNYGQYCGLAAALDVVGERWTLLIVRELLTGPCRYGELLANLSGIGTNLLAERLRYLTEAGVVRQVPRPESRGRMYELTEQGAGLRGAVLEMARWGLGVLGAPEAEDQVRPRWGVLALEAMIRPEGEGPDEVYEFRVDDEVFHIRVDGGVAAVVHGPATGVPVLTVRTDALTFIEIGAGRLTPVEATLTRRLTMEGEDAAILRCSRRLGLVH